MKKHDPIFSKLPMQKRLDLASISMHPGMAVLIEDIGEGHAKQQLLQIMDVDVDDPERTTKLSAISATAYAMKLFLELLRKEMSYNFEANRKEEEAQRKRAMEEGQ